MLQLKIVVTVLILYHCAALDQLPITFNEFLQGSFTPRSFSCRWIDGKTCVFQDGEQNVNALNAELNTTSLFIDGNILKNLSATDYSLSQDHQNILIQYDRQAVYRHSITSRYSVYGNFTGQSGYYQISNGDLLSVAEWTPIGKGIVYVKDNDLYYLPTIPGDVIRLTTSGVPGIIFNGIPDWVYEEEVLGGGKSFEVSPKSTYIIYTEINDTNVPEMVYTEYGSPGNLKDQYPKQIKIKYPKAGQQNPSFKTFIRNLSDLEKDPIQIRSDPTGSTIFYSYKWINDDEYIEVIQNRVQNESASYRCSASTQRCTTIYEENNEWGWARDASITFNTNNDLFASIEPVSVENLGDFSHLVLRKGDGTSRRPLSSGQMVVKKIYGWYKNEIIFYDGSVVGKPTQQQLYSVNITDGSILCVSCKLVSVEQNLCTSSHSSFSTDLSYVIITCAGPDPYFTHLFASNSQLLAPIAILEENLSLREAIKTKIIPRTLSVKVPIGGGHEGEARLFLPPNIDLTKKYPLLIEVYAGPDTTNTMEEFGVGWESYLTGNLNIIYGLIDGRSSSNRGDDILFGAYRGLGFVEILDQINATRALQQTIPWIDSTRTAIWGWSYGGYATGRTLELDTGGVFKCGISVAPVTSWIYYDSIYTERYMGLPTESDNLAAYIAGDLVTDVSNFKNKQYLLVHGNADDNVHYQNSMMLARSLELADIPFQQQSYPEENHSLGRVHPHLYHTMQRFWENCFK